MEKYLFPDITNNVLKYLNKNNSFKLVNVSKYLVTNKKPFYNKYKFNYLIKDVDMDYAKLIMNVELGYYEDFNFNKFCNLQSLSIRNYAFNQPINNLPGTLKSLIINSCIFNQTLDNLPDGLESLKIWSKAFNKPVNKLPNTLNSLFIYSYVFDQPLDSLPNCLKSLTLEHCYAFNYPLDSLPDTLDSLIMRDCYIFNQPLNKLPNTLDSLILNFCCMQNHLDSIPTGIRSVVINGKIIENKI